MNEIVVEKSYKIQVNRQSRWNDLFIWPSAQQCIFNYNIYRTKHYFSLITNFITFRHDQTANNNYFCLNRI